MTVLKRRLHRFKPVLGPVWHRGRAIADAAAILPGRLRDHVVDVRRRATGRALRRWELRDLAKAVPYYQPRINYLGVAGQADAFREVRRVARHAILSLPIDWEMDDPRNCHHQIHHEQALTWFAPVVPTRVVEGNGGRRKRLLYVFEDLPTG